MAFPKDRDDMAMQGKKAAKKGGKKKAAKKTGKKKAAKKGKKK
jgi:hypothetical protein